MSDKDPQQDRDRDTFKRLKTQKDKPKETRDPDTDSEIGECDNDVADAPPDE